MKFIFTFLLSIISLGLLAQSVGDSITIPTFNYSQTQGGGIRDTMIDFPDDNQSYEKIIMLYNMRCKDGNVSVPGNTNYGCGEWDYSCNTYIHDSSRVDSVISFTNTHSISAFTGTSFAYLEFALFDYYQFRQQLVEINSTSSESLHTVGSGILPLNHVLATDNKSGKSQYLYTQSELAAAGVVAGEIDAILLDITNSGADANYLQMRIKHTDKTALEANMPDNEGFTEVYFYNYSLGIGENRIQFHTPFNWNGSSNIIIEFSFTNSNESNMLEVVGESTTMVSGIYANNGYNLNSVNGKIDIPTDAFSSISEEISVTFWSYGNSKVQPIHNSIFHGVDSDNNRQLNLHLPWGNGGIYFDCGNDGSGYDRIEKSATAEEYEGSWSHWAVTKNATTGDMKIYHNGELWQSGTGKTRLIDIQEFIIATSGTADRSYFGKIDEFRIWNTELNELTIQDWMYRDLTTYHPYYGNLVAYYKLDEGEGNLVADASINAETGTIEDFLFWDYEHGSKLNRGFVETMERPNIIFAQGDYNLNIIEEIVTDSVVITPNIVREYSIIPRYGTMMSDSINELSVNEYWESQYQYIYNPEGIKTDSIFAEATASIEIGELVYYNRYPSKYEIMSFVTPYGIYLDLGMEGKTWAFDVTDYAPILNGRKRMTMERGGQRQEDMDIKFVFILGTPVRDVIDINQLWRADSKGYVSIMADRSFEERDFYFNPDGDQFKLRSMITGHGQQGEFIKRHHTFNLNGGEIEYDWELWDECSTIPIYPQGGTWIYDRAGWCPGNPTKLHEYNITEYVTAGQTHSIDYGIVTASGTSNYIVNNQLVTYGEPNFSLDASVVEIIKPNNEDAKHERYNPACMQPEIVIQNTGSTTLTSLTIQYNVEGGTVEEFIWSGTLGFMEKDRIILTAPELTFWLGTEDKFIVNISNPNGEQDEYEYNNTLSTTFDDIHIYPQGEILTIQLLTNNVGNQSTYRLYNDDGSIYYERDNCDNNTTYNDEYFLLPGCYKLEILDSGDNGLEFWHQASQGEGHFKILNSNGESLYTFNPDFGRFAIHEFGIGNITNIDKIIDPFVINVFPNPTTDMVNVSINGLKDAKVSISLVNSISSIVLDETWELNNEDYSTTIDLQHLPSGVYFLYIKHHDSTQIKKIVKY